MSRPHLLWFLFVLAVAVIIIGIAAMQSNGATDNPLYVDASADQPCPRLDYRTPGYRHPWEPIEDPDKDPRTYA